MWYLPKDYVWVHTRVQKAHQKYEKDLSITTEFDIKEKVVIFKATVKIWEQIFTGSSFWEVWKEKAFEKLETVAVWRALAFAWFEIKEWIASADEMERFNQKQEEKEWYNDFEKHKEEMIKRIKDWETAEEIIKKLEEKYKISKETRQKILNLNK